MLLFLDEAVQIKLTGCETSDGVLVVPMSKDKHNELREEQKYPGITWNRMNREFSLSRYENLEDQLLYRKDEDGIDIVKIYAPPIPYDVTYQIELISKERFDMDVMELFMDGAFNPRGFTIPVKCHILPKTSEEEGKDIIVKFPANIMERRVMNDYEDPKNIYYRTIFTVVVEILIDPCYLKDIWYMIKNEVIVLVEMMDDLIDN